MKKEERKLPIPVPGQPLETVDLRYPRAERALGVTPGWLPPDLATQVPREQVKPDPWGTSSYQ